MLQLYSAPLSSNARRVGIALLEKQIAFELIAMQLDGDQFTADFTALNPMQRVPVLVDDGVTVIESLAILDYLEAKYPTPPLLPTAPAAIAQVRMAEILTITEIQPATLPLLKRLVELDVPAATLDHAKDRITRGLQVLERLLTPGPYFAGAGLTLGDIVAGTIIPGLPMFGVALQPYPNVLAWCDRLAQRPSWQQTAPAPEVVQAALPTIRKILATRH